MYGNPERLALALCGPDQDAPQWWNHRRLHSSIGMVPQLSTNKPTTLPANQSGASHEDGRKVVPIHRDAKLANTLFTLELTRRLGAEGSAVRAITSDLGFTRTNLAAHVGGITGGV